MISGKPNICPQKANLSRRMMAIGRWGLAAILMCVIAWMIATQDRQALEGLEINWNALVLSSWLLLLYTMLISERFRLLTNIYGGGRATEVIHFLRSLAISRILNGILPQAGNVYRGKQLKETIGLPWSGYLSVALVGGMIDLICLIFIGALLLLMLPFVPNILNSNGWTYPLVIALSLSIIACLTIGGLRNHTQSQSRSNDIPGFSGMRLRVFVGLVLVPKNLAVLSLQTLTAFCLLSLVIWLILFAIQLESGLVAAAILMTLTRAAQYISITPGNLGVRELMYAFAGNQLAIGMGAAVLSSIVLRVLNWMVIGVIVFASTLLGVNQNRNRY